MVILLGGLIRLGIQRGRHLSMPVKQARPCWCSNDYCCHVEELYSVLRWKMGNLFDGFSKVDVGTVMIKKYERQ